MMREDPRKAKARKLRNHRLHQQGIATSLVPAGPLMTHLETLTALGWSLEAIAAWNRHGTASGFGRVLAGRSTMVERKMAAATRLPVTVAVPEWLPDLVQVPSLGARRRVQALLRLGHRHDDITAAAGVSSWSFSRSRSYLRTNAADWRAFDAAFERLSAHPGTSVRARNRAAQAGYLAPLAWDDIDDPNEHPTQATEIIRPDDVDEAVVQRILAGEWRLHSTYAERVQVVARWTGSHNDLERHTGWNIARYLRTDEVAA